MLSETLFREPRRPGVHVLQARGVTQARELTTRRVCLTPGSSAELRTDGEETVVVLQQGAGAFACGGREWPVNRSSVFEERATALYIPPGETATITARSPLEAVAVSAPAPTGGAPAVAFPDDVRVNARGRGTYSREVHDIFTVFRARLLSGGAPVPDAFDEDVSEAAWVPVERASALMPWYPGGVEALLAAAGAGYSTVRE